MSFRKTRVEEQLRQVIADFLIRGFKFSLPGLVSVSRIEASPDLRQAKVFISVFGSDEQRERALTILSENIASIQKHINKTLVMKFCPKIQFFNDPGLAKAMEIQQRLQEIRQSSETPETQEHDE